MLICIPNILSQAQLAWCREQLAGAPWVDGTRTTGTQSAKVKHNQQLDQTSPISQTLSEWIITTITTHPQFISAALPLNVFPPLFNRYQDGEHFGIHTDNAIMFSPHSRAPMRTDLSVTLFLTDPESYDGGELTIETHYGAQEVKLNAGDLVLYPSTSLHQVKPVTRGTRVSAFFWLESMVRDDGQRTILYDLDQSIQTLTTQHGTTDSNVVRLSNIYHNLIRRWANT